MMKLIRILLFEFKYKKFIYDKNISKLTLGEYWLYIEQKKNMIRNIYLKYGGSIKEISIYIDQNYDIYRVDQNGRNPKGPSLKIQAVGPPYEKFIKRDQKINEILK